VQPESSDTLNRTENNKITHFELLKKKIQNVNNYTINATIFSDKTNIFETELKL